MKKHSFIILILIFISSICYGEASQTIYGKDVSEYWSVTPDDVKEKEEEKIKIDVSDLRKEIDWLSNELRKMRKEKVKQETDYMAQGEFELSSRTGRGKAESTYRLIYSYYRDISEYSNFSMKIDTMDGGYGSSTLREPYTLLFDFEGDVTTDLGFEKPVNIKATFGPGDIIHRDTNGVVPSEDYLVYRRLYPSFGFITELGGFDVKTSYIARVFDNKGEVSTSEVKIDLEKDFAEISGLGKVDLLLNFSVVFVNIIDPAADDYETFQGFGFRFKQSDDIYQELIIDNGSTKSDSCYLNYKAVFNNINDDSTDIIFDYHSVGKSYRKQFISNVFLPLNIFDKYILNDMIDIGLGIKHKLSNRIDINLRSNAVLNGDWKNNDETAGTSFTNEIGLDYLIDKDFIFSSLYRNFNVPSKTGPFANVLPRSSELVILSLKYLF